MATTTTPQTVPSADGTPIAYERTESGPPLVLVHGTTADHTRWEPVLPALTVVVLDGQAHAAMNTAPGLFVEEVLAFLRKTG